MEAMSINVPPSPSVKAQEMLSPKLGTTADQQQMVEMLKRVQKLELATNRLLTDSGKMGEGYMLPGPTASENAIALAQKTQID